MNNNSEMSEATLPSREELAGCVIEILHRGKSRNPDVFLIEADRQRFVLKDFSPRGTFVRNILGPWLVDREVRAEASAVEGRCRTARGGLPCWSPSIPPGGYC